MTGLEFWMTRHGHDMVFVLASLAAQDEVSQTLVFQQQLTFYLTQKLFSDPQVGSDHVLGNPLVY